MNTFEIEFTVDSETSQLFGKAFNSVVITLPSCLKGSQNSQLILSTTFQDTTSNVNWIHSNGSFEIVGINLKQMVTYNVKITHIKNPRIAGIVNSPMICTIIIQDWLLYSQFIIQTKESFRKGILIDSILEGMSSLTVNIFQVASLNQVTMELTNNFINAMQNTIKLTVQLQSLEIWDTDIIEIFLSQEVIVANIQSISITNSSNETLLSPQFIVNPTFNALFSKITVSIPNGFQSGTILTNSLIISLFPINNPPFMTQILLNLSVKNQMSNNIASSSADLLFQLFQPIPLNNAIISNDSPSLLGELFNFDVHFASNEPLPTTGAIYLQGFGTQVIIDQNAISVRPITSFQVITTSIVAAGSILSFEYSNLSSLQSIGFQIAGLVSKVPIVQSNGWEIQIVKKVTENYQISTISPVKVNLLMFTCSSEGCQSCFNLHSVCVDCKSGYTFKDFKCTKSDGISSPANQQRCLSDETCFECDSLNIYECKQCKSGFFLNSMQTCDKIQMIQTQSTWVSAAILGGVAATLLASLISPRVKFLYLLLELLVCIELISAVIYFSEQLEFGTIKNGLNVDFVFLVTGGVTFILTQILCQFLRIRYSKTINECMPLSSFARIILGTLSFIDFRFFYITKIVKLKHFSEYKLSINSHRIHSATSKGSLADQSNAEKSAQSFSTQNNISSQFSLKQPNLLIERPEGPSIHQDPTFLAELRTLHNLAFAMSLIQSASKIGYHTFNWISGEQFSYSLETELSLVSAFIVGLQVTILLLKSFNTIAKVHPCDFKSDIMDQDEQTYKEKDLQQSYRIDQEIALFTPSTVYSQNMNSNQNTTSSYRNTIERRPRKRTRLETIINLSPSTQLQKQMDAPQILKQMDVLQIQKQMDVPQRTQRRKRTKLTDYFEGQSKNKEES